MNPVIANGRQPKSKGLISAQARAAIRFILLTVLCLILANLASAQGQLYSNIAWRYTPAGAFPASGGTVTICTATAAGTPCTPTISVFQDAALSIPVSNPLPVCSSSPQVGCIDGLGNFSFYMTPGSFTYTITGAGLTAYGPIPANTSCSAGVTCVTSSGNNAFTGNNTHSGTETFTGPIVCSSINGVICVDQQAGATADVKFANACSALTVFGGVLDARGFGGSNQTIAATVSCGGASKVVTFLFDPSTVYQPSASSTSMFQFNSYNVMRDLFIDTSGQASYTGIPIQNSSTTSTQFAKLYNVKVKMASGSTAPCMLLAGTSASIFASQNRVYDFTCFAGTGGDGVKMTASGGGFVNANDFYSLNANGPKYTVEMLVTDNTAGSAVAGNKVWGAIHEASSLATSLAAVHMNTASAANAMFANQFYGLDVFDLTAGNVSAIIDSGNICGTLFMGQLPAGSGGVGITDNSTCAQRTQYHDIFDGQSALAGTKIGAGSAVTSSGAGGTMASVLTATSAAFATATTAGTCVQNTTAVASATTSMAVSISPVSTPGVGAVWSAFVSSAGNVTINECAVATSAGGTIAFNIRVTP